MDSTMQEFIRLVRSMRSAQKVYFRSREKDVDAQLAKFDNKLPGLKQIGLWEA